MKNKDLMQWVAISLIGFVAVFGFVKHTQPKQQTPPPTTRPFVPQPPPTAPTKPATPSISTPTPNFLEYAGIVEQIKKWNQEAPDLTEVGTYGKSSKKTDLYYIRVTNKKDKKEKPRVLITACIHGNEPWSTGTIMAYAGNMLASYGKDKEVTDLLDTRDIYFVPVVSPDSYPNSRHVDGVDPNRNFPGSKSGKPVAPVQGIMDLCDKIKPQAVISGHTWGRVLLIPPGNTMKNCPDHDLFVKVIGQTAKMMNYKMIRACDMYGAGGGLAIPGPQEVSTEYMTPIYGSDVDWYYGQGAMAIVMEIGTHQRRPTPEEIRSEFDRTYKGFLYFVREAKISTTQSPK